MVSAWTFLPDPLVSDWTGSDRLIGSVGAGVGIKGLLGVTIPELVPGRTSALRSWLAVLQSPVLPAHDIAVPVLPPPPLLVFGSPRIGRGELDEVRRDASLLVDRGEADSLRPRELQGFRLRQRRSRALPGASPYCAPFHSFVSSSASRFPCGRIRDLSP